MTLCALTTCRHNDAGHCTNPKVAGPVAQFEVLWQATGRKPGKITECPDANERTNHGSN